MVDADDPAVGRVDSATDPTALREGDIEQELRENPNLKGDAVDAFADEIAARRSDVLADAKAELSDAIQPNPANPDTIQVRTHDGQLGPKIEGAGQVDLDVDSMGDVHAELPDGQSVKVAELDLQQGRDGPPRKHNAGYSKRQHPAQQPGGGR